MRHNQKNKIGTPGDVAKLVFLFSIPALLITLTVVWNNKTAMPPLEPIPVFTMPSPNAYDTLVLATTQSVDKLEGIEISPVPKSTGEPPMSMGISGVGGMGSIPPKTEKLTKYPAPKTKIISDQPLRGRLELLQANAKAIETVKLALKQEYAHPLTYNFNQLFPELAKFRGLARILYLQA
jgi:hypothetical protein